MKVTKEHIDEMVSKAETQEHIFWGKELVVSYRLENGFTVLGRAACVDPSEFNIEIGREVCRRDVEKTLWLLEGYRLQLELGPT